MSRVLAARRRALARAGRLLHPGAYAELERRHGAQREAFERLRPGFAERVRALGTLAAPVEPAWQRFERSLAAELGPAPPFRFLDSPTAAATLVAHGRRRAAAQLRYLRTRLAPGQLAGAVEEDLAGGPTLAVPGLLTSATRVQQVHHLVRFLDATGAAPGEIDPVVEWGGGFGGTARVLGRLLPGVRVIVADLPLLSCLQWLYLSAVLGEDAVRLVEDAAAPLPDVPVVLCPVPLLPDDLRAGLFLSTWALSESPAAVQRRVAASGFLGARRLLLAVQRANRTFPDADLAGRLAREAGAALEPVRGGRGSFYALR